MRSKSVLLFLPLAILDHTAAHTHLHKRLARDLPSNDPVPRNKVSIVDSQPDSSSAGNLNPISHDGTESTASGDSNKDMGQLLNDGSQSPPKDHGGNKVAEETYELYWKIG